MILDSASFPQRCRQKKYQQNLVCRPIAFSMYVDFLTPNQAEQLVLQFCLTTLLEFVFKYVGLFPDSYLSRLPLTFLPVRSALQSSSALPYELSLVLRILSRVHIFHDACVTRVYSFKTKRQCVRLGNSQGSKLTHPKMLKNRRLR